MVGNSSWNPKEVEVLLNICNNPQGLNANDMLSLIRNQNPKCKNPRTFKTICQHIYDMNAARKKLPGVKLIEIPTVILAARKEEQHAEYLSKKANESREEIHIPNPEEPSLEYTGTVRTVLDVEIELNLKLCEHSKQAVQLYSDHAEFLERVRYVNRNIIRNVN